MLIQCDPYRNNQFMWRLDYNRGDCGESRYVELIVKAVKGWKGFNTAVFGFNTAVFLPGGFTKPSAASYSMTCVLHYGLFSTASRNTPAAPLVLLNFFLATLDLHSLRHLFSSTRKSQHSRSLYNPQTAIYYYCLFISFFFYHLFGGVNYQTYDPWCFKYVPRCYASFNQICSRCIAHVLTLCMDFVFNYSFMRQYYLCTVLYQMRCYFLMFYFLFIHLYLVCVANLVNINLETNKCF